MADGVTNYALKFGAMQMQNQIAKEKAMSGKKGKKGKGKNKRDEKGPTIIEKAGDFKLETTLHGYPMIGPFTPGNKDVWYCDNKTCQYTQHGVYRRYKIQNWRSQQFGKKFVLCDGCVRQYQKVKPVQQQAGGASNVNVKVNIAAQPGAQPGAQQYVQQPQYAQQQYGYGQHGQMIAQPQQIVQQPQGQYVNYGMQQQGYQQQGMQQPVFTQHQQPMQPQMQGMNGMNGYQAQQQQQQAMQPQVMVVKQPTQLDQEQKVQHNEGLNNGNMNNNANGGIQIIKQGWMMKKGDIVKSWKKRYFVLKTNQTLNYYESDNAVMVKGTCQLNKVKSVKKKSTQSFEVQTPKRKWCFACKDTATRDDWVSKVKQVAGK